jgi:nickel transport protein
MLPLLRTALAAALVLGASRPGGAHELWLTLSTVDQAPQVRVNYGHASKREAPRAPQLLELIALTQEGRTSLRAGLKPAPPEVPPALLAPLGTKPGRTLVAATYDAGYWTTLRDGTRLNASRRLVPDAREGRWSVKYAKAAFGPGAPWLRVVGHTLEIVPVEIPGPTAGAIRVRVLFRGAPLPGADLYYGDSGMEPERAGVPAYTTDPEGIATVPIRKAGSQVLTVRQTVSPSGTPTLADEDVYTATFAFRLDEPSVN